MCGGRTQPGPWVWQRCGAWDLLSPQCLTLPSLIPVLVAVAVAGDKEQGDEDAEPWVEEGPDDVVTMTLKREASIRQREFSRRWELDLSSQHSPLAPALLPRGRGGFCRGGVGSLPTCSCLSWTVSGASDLDFIHISVTQPYSVIFLEAFGDEGCDFMAASA